MISTGPMLSIVHDTWRQSRQQVVFIVMLVILALFIGLGVGLVKTFDQPDGSQAFGFVLNDEPTVFFDTVWASVYLQQKAKAEGKPIDLWSVQDEDITEVEALVKDIPRLQRSVEAYTFYLAGWLFTIAMCGFIAASAGYFPGLLTAGSIDVIVAKPNSRLTVFFGKYLGGLVLFSLAVAGIYLFFMLGLGLQTGVYPYRLLLALPVTLFCGAVLYALLAFLGVVSRSATLCVVLGLVFFLVIDTILGLAQQAQQFGAFKEIGWLDTTIEITRYIFPNFTLMKDTATSSVLNIPGLDWQPIMTGGVWMVLCLALGFWRFRRMDF